MQFGAGGTSEWLLSPECRALGLARRLRLAFRQHHAVSAKQLHSERAGRELAGAGLKLILKLSFVSLGRNSIVQTLRTQSMRSGLDKPAVRALRGLESKVYQEGEKLRLRSLEQPLCGDSGTFRIF